MIVHAADGDLIVRYAWEDQFPAAVRYAESSERNCLRNKARDSVIRFALHHGLRFDWDHDFYGSRWRNPDGTVYLGPIMISCWRYPGEDGVCGWRSVARVTGER